MVLTLMPLWGCGLGFEVVDAENVQTAAGLYRDRMEGVGWGGDKRLIQSL